MLSIKAHEPQVPVTALAFVSSDAILIVGRGSWLTAYEVATGRTVLKAQAMTRAVIHGISARGDRGVAFGQREVRLIRWQLGRSPFGGPQVELGAALPILRDFVKDAILLRPTDAGSTAASLVAVGFAHNFVEVLSPTSLTMHLSLVQRALMQLTWSAMGDG